MAKLFTFCMAVMACLALCQAATTMGWADLGPKGENGYCYISIDEATKNVKFFVRYNLAAVAAVDISSEMQFCCSHCSTIRLHTFASDAAQLKAAEDTLNCMYMMIILLHVLLYANSYSYLGYLSSVRACTCIFISQLAGTD